MRFSILAALIAGALAAPTNPQIKVENKYIVRMKSGLSDATIQSHKDHVSTLVNSRFHITGVQFTGISRDLSIADLKLYAGHFDAATVAELKKDPNVAEVTPQQIYRIVDVPQVKDKPQAKANVVQRGATWGLGRISHKNTGSTDYVYDSAAGEGSTVWVVDTGIRTSHREFEGRATWETNTSGDGIDSDGNGHGTHCAGTAVGKTYGVAKKAEVRAVKVLDSQGSGSDESVIAGLQYVFDAVRDRGIRKSVVSMSLGGSPSPPLDAVVRKLVNGGIPVAVAAGNESQDSSNSSPAREPLAITVGATNSRDAKSGFSNFGAGVDIFAPGEAILSAWGTSDSATNTISGTSMATPHVAGFVAYLLSLHEDFSPSQVVDFIQQNAITGKLTSIGRGSVNRLLYNGLDG